MMCLLSGAAKCQGRGGTPFCGRPRAWHRRTTLAVARMVLALELAVALELGEVVLEEPLERGGAFTGGALAEPDLATFLLPLGDDLLEVGEERGGHVELLPLVQEGRLEVLGRGIG